MKTAKGGVNNLKKPLHISIKDAFERGLIIEDTEIEFRGHTGIIGNIIPREGYSSEFFFFSDFLSGSFPPLPPFPEEKGYKYSYVLLGNDTSFIDIYPKKNKVSNPSKLPKIELSVEKKGGKTVLKFRVDKKIETFYKNDAQKVVDSTIWPVQFYYIPRLTTDLHYKTALKEYDLFDDYGQPFIKEGKLNIAFIRTVGGKGTIPVNDEGVPFAEMSRLFNLAVKFLRTYFEDYYRDYKLSGKLSIEV